MRDNENLRHIYEKILLETAERLNTLEVFKTVERIKTALNKGGYAFYLTGGLAMARYGYSRFTDDADIVVRGSREEVIDFLSLRGFKHIENTNILRDRKNGVGVDILPGGGKVGPVKMNFPVPEDDEELVSLEDLISLKLDCYQSIGITRSQDLTDAIKLIEIHDLPKDFPVDDTVKDLYDLLWTELKQRP